MKQSRPFEVYSSFTSWPGHLLECDLELTFDFSTPPSPNSLHLQSKDNRCLTGAWPAERSCASTCVTPAICAFRTSGCNFINQNGSGVDGMGACWLLALAASPVHRALCYCEGVQCECTPSMSFRFLFYQNGSNGAVFLLGLAFFYTSFH